MGVDQINRLSAGSLIDLAGNEAPIYGKTVSVGDASLKLREGAPRPRRC